MNDTRDILPILWLAILFLGEPHLRRHSRQRSQGARLGVEYYNGVARYFLALKEEHVHSNNNAN